MAAAVDLEEHPLARHPLPAAAIADRATGPDRADRGLGEDAPQRPRSDDEPLALGEQLGQVGVIDPGVRRRRELDETRPQGFVKPIGRCPAVVAAGEAGRAVG